MSEIKLPRILIVDLRSQLTNNIERVIRELGYRSAILSPEKTARWLRAGNETDAIILSGGDFSVYDEAAPRLPSEIFTTRRSNGRTIPILGICYGHQAIAARFGGKVVAQHAEHGRTSIELLVEGSTLFRNTEPEQTVWMNHGDSVVLVPSGFVVTATSIGTGVIAAMENLGEKIFAVQFHPESTHTTYGTHLFRNFLEFCECVKDWSPASMVDAIRGSIEDGVGGETVAIGISGGVDSTVAAALAAPVLGPRLHGFTIDANHLRMNELVEIEAHAKASGLLNYRVIDMHDKVALFAGITDAERKRTHVFQKGIYVPGIVGEVNRVGASRVVQGSLAPDFIESGETGGQKIKTHHNIGIDVGVRQLHPLSSLFKYEVRALARELGLPESVSERKPFPGPGLFIRIIGISVNNAILECLREATFAVERILQRDRTFWLEEISQPVVGYVGTPTVGQKGDGRVYAGSIVVRAVKTLDFMTAEGVQIPSEMRREITQLVTRHPLVVRAWFDETDKPPGTTEFE